MKRAYKCTDTNTHEQNNASYIRPLKIDSSRMKKLVNTIILTCIAFPFTILTSCDELWDETIDGNGKKQIENRPLEEFSSIEADGSFRISVNEESDYSATVITDENLVDLIITRVSGHKLIIRLRDGVNVNPSHTIEIDVSAPLVNDITLNGSGSIYCNDLNLEQLSINLAGSGYIECKNITSQVANIKLSGSGDINCEIETDDISTIVEGSGEIRLKGSCINAEHEIVGSGKVKSEDMTSDVSTIRISGSGVANANVNNSLNVSITGSGIVNYWGNPSIDSHISGSGKIIKR